MKVLIVGFFSKTYMPYIEKYEKALNEKNIDYDIIEFDRDETGSIIKEGKSYIFRHKTGTNKLQLLWLSFRYRNFILKMMRKNKYDKLIVLTTMPGILICNKLFKKYSNKYIFDYRDYTYEKIPLYRKIVDKIIKNSACTFMSSKGYMDYFENKEKICITHNISNIEDKVDIAPDLKNKESINIGFLGYVRYFDVNSKLIDSLKNDKKYNFTYVGTPFADCDLEGFCKENGITNVEFKGKYQNSEKPMHYVSMDMINSIYSLNSAEVQPAIPNRLYDAALFKMPIIVAKGTYLSKIVEEYKLGFSIDVFNEDIKEVLNEYVNNFDSVKFTEYCNKFLDEVYLDEASCEKELNNFISYERNNDE